jgi:hypothetical protein
MVPYGLLRIGLFEDQSIPFGGTRHHFSVTGRRVPLNTPTVVSYPFRGDGSFLLCMGSEAPW